MAGLVYVDPTDLRSQEQDLDYLRAGGYTTDEAARHIERVRKRMAGYVGSRTGPYRAEMEVIQVNESSYSAEFRRLPPLAPIPVSVLIAGRFQPEIWAERPCEPRDCQDRWLQFRRKWLEELVPEVGEGTITIAAGAGTRSRLRIRPSSCRRSVACCRPWAPSRRSGRARQCVAVQSQDCQRC